MAENLNQPRKDDAVLGGQNPSLVNAAVLGGIEAVKRRLASSSEAVRIAALPDALKYGEKGFEVVFDILKNENGTVQNAAWKLLWQSSNAKTIGALLYYLPEYRFEIVKVNERGQQISRIPSNARFFSENLASHSSLTMVLIPGGTFLMGSLENKNETPQHQVTVPPFFMSKYPITQAQWQAVAALPQIEIFLNSEPSCFKGSNRPVEQVSWHEAREFCARLCQRSKHIYRLPSEAEWEYACRAGTSTKFHFGDAIATNLANYSKLNYAYQSPTSSIAQTTEVGRFPPNAFGLYDLHGNVWEWCADNWHENYHGAPQDGNVWTSSINRAYRMLRGGSWGDSSNSCRSSYRLRLDAGNRLVNVGFRVVCCLL
jgi:formylglycine-generating enzyme required for sulfatase activity